MIEFKEAWNLALMLERRVMCWFLVWKLGGMVPLGEPVIDVSIIYR
jgi:hypothetical protein